MREHRGDTTKPGVTQSYLMFFENVPHRRSYKSCPVRDESFTDYARLHFVEGSCPPLWHRTTADKDHPR